MRCVRRYGLESPDPPTQLRKLCVQFPIVEVEGRRRLDIDPVRCRLL